MILESAVLMLRPGEEEAFEKAMREASPLIQATPGFLGMEVRRCIETPNQYLLLVRWARLEDHTEGFRGSARYQDWRAKLHSFYEPFPTVEHYAAPFLSS